MYLVAILGALLSVHNYPPMGWNTIDGVFFCMLGLYFILKDRSSISQIAFGCLFLVLGVFSKQSFYFMPIFLFIYLLLIRDFKRLQQYMLFGLLGVVGYIAFKYSNGSLLPFWEQTFQRTSSSALVDAGVKAYYLSIKYNIWYVLPAIIGVWLLHKYVANTIAFFLFNCVLAGLLVLFFYKSYGSWEAIPYVFQLLLIASFLFAGITSLKDKKYLLLILLLALSWSASISNGYRTPIHFSLPIMASIYFFFMGTRGGSRLSFLHIGVVVIFFGTFFYGYQTLYRDSNRQELTYEMGEVFTELRFIKSDRATFEKYKELKALAREKPNFTVLPSATLAHYLTKTINPIGTDWPLDVETNNTAKELVARLTEKGSYVFLEKKEYSQYQLDSYSIKKLIEEHWNIVHEGRYFTVYKAP